MEGAGCNPEDQWWGSGKGSNRAATLHIVCPLPGGCTTPFPILQTFFLRVWEGHMEWLRPRGAVMCLVLGMGRKMDRA